MSEFSTSAETLPIVVLARRGSSSVITQTTDRAPFYVGRPDAYAKSWENFCRVYASSRDSEPDRTFDFYRMPVREGMSAAEYYVNPLTCAEVVALGGELFQTVLIAPEHATSRATRPFDRTPV